MISGVFIQDPVAGIIDLGNENTDTLRMIKQQEEKNLQNIETQIETMNTHMKKMNTQMEKMNRKLNNLVEKHKEAKNLVDAVNETSFDLKTDRK
jgi:methyl-accepting chemotaxis protein